MILSLFITAEGRAAYLMESTAQLSRDGASTPLSSTITAVRFETLGFYRYDPGAADSYPVHRGYLADVDSLSGSTPQTTDQLAPPSTMDGQELDISAPLPLAPAAGFDGGETVFVRIEKPLLEPSAFGTRADGRRFMAVSLRVEATGGGIETVTFALTETVPGSEVFLGYLPDADPAQLASTELTLLYDDYGEIDDRDAENPPALVGTTELTQLNARKLANVGQQPVPIGEGLFLSKQAGRSSVMHGDFLQYRLRLQNETTETINDAVLEDRLPSGFRYQSGSLRINGEPGPDPQIGANGRSMELELDTLGPGETLRISYVTEVTVGSRPGEAVNRAIVRTSTGDSNEDRARVHVERAFFDDHAFLMGRIIIGECGERDGRGQEGVRLYLSDGTSVVTDEQGRWHIEGVRPGTNVLQVDTDTLGPRYRLRRCDDNTRSAGNIRSRFVNVQGGTLWREDWYLEEKPEVTGRIEQQLSTSVQDNHARVELELANGETVFETVRSELRLPAQLKYVSGTARLDGEPIGDPEIGDDGHTLRFALDTEGQYWRHRLEVRLAPDPDVADGSDQPIRARTVARTSGGRHAEADSAGSYTVESSALLHLHARVLGEQQITLRPRFDSMATVPGPEGWQQIEEGVAHLRDVEDLYLEVVGHTDNLPIRWRPQREIRSNRQLSEVRARNIADYLAGHLEIERDRITARGAGASQPVDDNTTAGGRARNRRVEINATVIREERPATLETVEPGSGLDRSEDDDAAPQGQRGPGFANLTSGMRIADPVISINGVLEKGLKPELRINDEPVSNDRIGMVLEDHDSGLLHYTWVGVELPWEGEHRVVLRGMDSFGNSRFSQEIDVTRTGRIAHIRAREMPENVADGRTPVRARVELLDEHGRRIQSPASLRLESGGGLEPLDHANDPDNPLEQKTRVVEVDADGYAWFEPVSEAGTYRVRLASDQARSDSLEVRVTPELRDWILVGFAQGTVGYNHLKRNIEDMPAAEEDFFTDGEASFFARGRVRGDWLLTAAYDSRREPEDQPLGHDIDPEQWYVLYGDNTRRRHDAPSSEKLYVRMEREDFHIMFGDFDTGLTVTDLSRYQRRLTGLKTEYTGRWLTAQAFAAETGQAFVRDEIPGDGTSGIYRLDQRPLVPGSEQVRIETRDRFTNEVIESENRTRFIDYSIDYDLGQLFFREPVRVQDESFNPVRIVVEYEVEDGDDKVTGGGRVVLHDPGKAIELGVTGVRDGADAGDGRLGGADLTWKPNERHRVQLEGARTDRDTGNGREEHDAWMAEHRYTSERLDTRLLVREQQSEFGLGQQSLTDNDIRRAEASGRYRIGEHVAIRSELTRQQRLDGDNRRDTAEARMEYEREDWKVFAGTRSAGDRVDGETFRSDQLLAGGQRDLMEQRLRLRARGETTVSGQNENTDYPNRLTTGADYRLTRNVTLFGNQEHAWGHEFRARETRGGLRATPWRGATVRGELGESQDEFGPRLFSHAGLHQTMEVTRHWSADFGVDRSQTLRNGDANPTFDERRPLTSGSRTLDYTAATAGAGYRTARWQVTSRGEYRTSDLDDKWLLTSGFHHRLNGTNTLAGRLFHIDRRIHSGERTTETSLDFSLAHRPLDGDWFVLNRTRLVLDSLDTELAAQQGRRIVNNLTSNFSPSGPHQLSLQHGGRYVRDTIDEERFTGYTDLWAGEYRHDIGRRFDIGARASVLNSWSSGVRKESYGLMVGYTPIRDVWLSAGYNFEGFHDDDFDNAISRVGGVVIDFRIKFDQHSFRRDQ